MAPSPAPLFVLLGAGASHDCTTRNDVEERWKPPLVTQLFESRFAELQDLYPLVQTAAREIGRAQAQKDPRSLEQFISQRYRHGGRPNDLRIYYSLTWYLQHLLWQASEEYTRHADNYGLLVRELEDLDQVVYVTLNYDTLLDRQLEVHGGMRFTSPASYLTGNPQFSLIKLHGSVNWSYPITTPGIPAHPWATPPGDLEWDDDETRLLITALPPAGAFDDVRFRGSLPPHRFFPALSVPLGADDLLSCPASHARYLKDRLAEADALDLLVIGYSAYDQEVLNILAASDTPLRSVFVVNKDSTSAEDVLTRLTRRLGPPSYPGTIYQRSFTSFIHQSGIEDYMRWLRARHAQKQR